MTTASQVGFPGFRKSSEPEFEFLRIEGDSTGRIDFAGEGADGDAFFLGLAEEFSVFGIDVIGGCEAFAIVALDDEDELSACAFFF